MRTKTTTKNIGLENFLTMVNDEEFRTDFFTQRGFAWKNEMVNELVRTVLIDDYIPPIILCNETLDNGNIQTFIADGIQRSTSLIKFRYENHKISAAISNPIITYSVLVRDENGKVVKDEDGNQVREDREFNLKGKTYNDLPKELQDQFNNYQIGSATHLDCTYEQIAEYVKRYNNHISMKSTQIAFTFLVNYAEDVRRIMEHRFFLDGGSYTVKEHENGVLERVIAESVMLINFKDEWKKDSKKMFKFLNENATTEMFEEFESLLDELLEIVDEDEELISMFTSKDSFILFNLFNEFKKLNKDNSEFSDFLHKFIEDLSKTEINDKTWNDLCSIRGTKDTVVVSEKTEYLTKLMLEFFNIKLEEKVTDEELKFVKENVDKKATKDDVELYKDIMSDLLWTIDDNMLASGNMESLLGIVAYSTINDIDLDDWVVDYNKRNDCCLSNQVDNFTKMKNDLVSWVKAA